jgi:formate hydrogenlyase subunit 3/multisubunit Na+/H+ antiporter MnhD subunit
VKRSLASSFCQSRLESCVGIAGERGLATAGAAGERLLRAARSTNVALLASLLGMLVLASARELILLFVAFELMSIPLYFLTDSRSVTSVARKGR